MNFEQMKAVIFDAVDVNNVDVLNTTVTNIQNEESWIDPRMLWSWAMEHAIDIGSLKLVTAINNRFPDIASGKNQWSIYRSAGANHHELVQYFIFEKKKHGTFESYMLSEVAKRAAENNNIPMLQFALDLIFAEMKDPTPEQQKDEIYALLADRSGPVKCAATNGHVAMVQYLVTLLKACLPDNRKEHMMEEINNIPAFFYGRNVALSSNHHEMVSYLNSIMGNEPPGMILKDEAKEKPQTNRFFSKKTGMDVSDEQLTDEAMAAFWLKINAR